MRLTGGGVTAAVDALSRCLLFLLFVGFCRVCPSPQGGLTDDGVSLLAVVVVPFGLDDM